MKTSILIHPEELSKVWIDRMVDCGITTLGLHPEGGKNAIKSLQALLDSMQTQQFRDLIDYAKEKGLQVNYELHAMGYLLPRELFDTYPEYFRMDKNGNRVNDLNLCPSNEAALQLVADNAVSLAGQLYGSGNTYFFWLDDARQGLCQCEKCRSLSASDQQLLVINAMAKALRKKDPNAKIAYLAYFDALQIPQKEKPADGVFLEYAPMDKWNIRFRQSENITAGAALEQQMCKPLLDFFGREDSVVLEYWIDNSMFSDWKKPPKKLCCDALEVKRDVAYYLETGYENISVFGCFLGPDYEALYGAPDIQPMTDAFQ